MTTKPRKQAGEAAGKIEADLIGGYRLAGPEETIAAAAEVIEQIAIRPVADPLAGALEYCEEQIGWKGDRDQDSDHYACEHCNGPPELDFKDLQHEPHCPVLTIRAALAAYREDGK